MRIDTPDGFTEIPESLAVIKKLNGLDIIVINGYFFPYSEYTYKEFLKQCSSYVDVVDMYPEEMRQTVIMNDESLTAFAWWNRSKWENISDKITYHKSQIEKLNTL